jgi:DNA polymerase III subunit beta
MTTATRKPATKKAPSVATNGHHPEEPVITPPEKPKKPGRRKSAAETEAEALATPAAPVPTWSGFMDNPPPAEIVLDDPPADEAEAHETNPPAIAGTADAMNFFEARGDTIETKYEGDDRIYMLTLQGEPPSSQVTYTGEQLVALAQAAYAAREVAEQVPFDGAQAAADEAAETAAPPAPAKKSRAKKPTKAETAAQARRDAELAELATHGTVVPQGNYVEFTPTDGLTEEVPYANIAALLATLRTVEPPEDAAAEGAPAPGLPVQTIFKPVPVVQPVAFSCLRERLLEALQLVAPAQGGTSKKNTLPVLNNVLFLVRDGRLELAATNLSIGIRASFGVKVLVEGAFTVPLKLLIETLKLLRGERIEIELDPKSITMFWTCGSQDGQIRGIEEDEFPVIPATDPLSQRWSMPGGALVALTDHVTAAAAADDTRPVLAGVLLQLREAGVTAAAADGFRLHTTAVDLEKMANSQMHDVIIPAGAMEALGKFLIPDEHVSIQVSAGQVIFAQDGRDLVTRTIDGRFPDFPQIIPMRHNARLLMDRAELIKVFMLGELLTEASIAKVRFPETGQVSIASVKSEVGGQTSRVDASTAFITTKEWEKYMKTRAEDQRSERPTEITVALNGKFMLQALRACTTKEVAFEVQSPVHPIVIREVGGDENFLIVLMPMTAR